MGHCSGSSSGASSTSSGSTSSGSTISGSTSSGSTSSGSKSSDKKGLTVHESLKTFKNNKATLINTLSNHQACNVTQFDGKPKKTYNFIGNVPKSPSCALYCAHDECNSAMTFYNKNKGELEIKCGEIHYLKSGVKDMMGDTRFKLQNRNACQQGLNL